MIIYVNPVGNLVLHQKILTYDRIMSHFNQSIPTFEVNHT